MNIRTGSRGAVHVDGQALSVDPAAEASKRLKQTHPSSPSDEASKRLKQTNASPPPHRWSAEA